MKAKSKKPKFSVGQVVALWRWKPSSDPLFFRIKSFYYDESDQLRYTFDAHAGDEMARNLCPVEELLTPLTEREIGARSQRKAMKP